ncbi:MAG: tyrosine-type recombinase/integrase, partial [Nitrospira sp.]
HRARTPPGVGTPLRAVGRPVRRATRESVLLHLICVQAHVHLLRLTHCPTKSSLSPFPSPAELEVKAWGRCLTLHIVEQGRQGNQASVSFVEKATVSAISASATRLFESGSDIRTIQELLRHRDVKTPMIYTHVLNRGAEKVPGTIDLPITCCSGRAAIGAPLSGDVRPH